MIIALWIVYIYGTKIKRLNQKTFLVDHMSGRTHLKPNSRAERQKCLAFPRAALAISVGGKLRGRARQVQSDLSVINILAKQSKRGN